MGQVVSLGKAIRHLLDPSFQIVGLIEMSPQLALAAQNLKRGHFQNLSAGWLRGAKSARKLIVRRQQVN